MTYTNSADKPQTQLEAPNLAKPHFDHLIAEGFTDADIAIIESEGVRSIEYDEARDLAFSVREGGVSFSPLDLAVTNSGLTTHRSTRKVSHVNTSLQ